MARSAIKRVRVEKVGGLAGFGGAHLKSEGEIDLDHLSDDERSAIEQLLAKRATRSEGLSRDAFRYRLSWDEGGDKHSIEVGESEAPETVRAAAKDRLV